MTFGLGTFARLDDVFPGLLVDDRVIDLRRALDREDLTTLDLLRDWDRTLPLLRSIAESDSPAIETTDVRPLSPVQPSGQIICTGANYTKHVTQIVYTMTKNQGDARTDEELREFAAATARARRDDPPFFFVGLPSALAGARDDVVLWGPHEQHDWELELAVVIGRRTHRVPVEKAMDAIAGYTISNDITVRDAMFRRDIPMTDFLHSKNRPTYFPTGPVIVPTEFVPDPSRLRIRLSVNGELMQDELVSDIIQGIPELVSAASHVTVLSPGDMILTGSPAGNAGHHGNRWLRPGDLIESSITGLGTQRNLCVAPVADDDFAPTTTLA
ncbi:fumarylacetoacetate hydrolase family protein [Microbacterium sp. NPDC058062]|uniref:fumarylacetoacetate hydrolase family protein n=1 Tax=Microbacterium sp. NPDC058062 TaxID=3346320 RepID=UPI0036DCA4FC